MLHIVWIESLCGMEEICLHCFGLQQQQQQTRIWQYFNYFICRDFLIGFQRTTQNNFKRKQIYGSQFMKQNCQLLLLSRHSSVFVCIWGRRVMQCFFLPSVSAFAIYVALSIPYDFTFVAIIIIQ